MSGKGDYPRPVDPDKWNNAPFWKARDERQRKANQQGDVQVSPEGASTTAPETGEESGVAES